MNYFSPFTYLKFKIPLSWIDTIGFLRSEDAEPFSRQVAQVRLIRCWWRRQKETGGLSQKQPENSQSWKHISCYTIIDVYCTVVLVRGFKIKSISQQSSDCLSQTVFVGLLSSLIQKNVRHQTRVSAVFHILIRPNKEKKGHHWDFYLQIGVGLKHKYVNASFVQQCEQMAPLLCKEAPHRRA